MLPRPPDEELAAEGLAVDCGEAAGVGVADALDVCCSVCCVCSFDVCKVHSSWKSKLSVKWAEPC